MIFSKTAEKKNVDDHRQKYVKIIKNCLGIEIADERLRFLQTKHLQCMSTEGGGLFSCKMQNT